jgi:hypothetical protein
LALASAFITTNRFKLRLRTRPENQAASRTARMSSETAVLRMSRFSAMGPPPRDHRVTDSDLQGIIAGGEAKMPGWSLGDVNVCHSEGYGSSRGGPIGA